MKHFLCPQPWLLAFVLTLSGLVPASHPLCGEGFPDSFGAPVESPLIPFPLTTVINLAADGRRPGHLWAGWLDPRGGLVRSEDGGASWRLLDGDPLAVDRIPFSVDALHPERLYYWRSEGVQRSEDGGLTWSAPVAPSPCSTPANLVVASGPPNRLFATGYALTAGCGLLFPDACYSHRSLDSGATWQCLEVETSFALAIDPWDGDKVYIGRFYSRDGGETWQESTGLAGFEEVLSIDPTEPRRLYAGTQAGLFRSIDGGETWQAAESGLAGRSVNGIAVHPSLPNNLYAVADGELFWSSDHGETWRHLDEVPLPAERLGPVVVHPLEPTAIYAASRGSGVVRRAVPLLIDCAGSPATLCLQDGRFAVTVDWRTRSGRSGVGTAHGLTDTTGAFSFFHQGNLELMVRIVDGRHRNDHFWLFLGSLSNVEFRLHVLDASTGLAYVVQNPAGRFASLGDTEAFPDASLPAASIEVLHRDVASRSPPLPSDAPEASAIGGLGACVPSATELCFGDFKATIRWRGRRGFTGHGAAVKLADGSGAFWFLKESNLEILLKIVDGRPINGHLWVFFGSLSDAEFTLKIENVRTGEFRQYFNPAGTFASRGDVRAF